MKRFIAALVLGSFLLVGCSGETKKEPAKTPAAGEKAKEGEKK